jgi:hypothetical protein
MDEIALPSRAIYLSWTESVHQHQIDENLSFFPELPKIGKAEQTHLNALVKPNFNLLVVTMLSGDVAGFGYGVVPLFLHRVGGDVRAASIASSLSHIDVVCRTDSGFQHTILATEKLEHYHSQIHRYVCFVAQAQLCVSYLQECLSEMESAWVDVMNNRLSEFGEQLLSMFLWGIQPPELAQFLSAEMDRKSFNEIAVNTRQKCSFVQRFCVVNIGQACEKLFAAVHQLAALSGTDRAFGLLTPQHEISFSSICHNVAQLSIKNVELTQVIR